MRNSKIDRLNNEIANTRAKIAELRKKLRVMEQQKTDLEDAEIISIVRSEKISDAELTLLLCSLRNNGDGKGASATGVSKPSKSKEEEHNANKDEN